MIRHLLNSVLISLYFIFLTLFYLLRKVKLLLRSCLYGLYVCIMMTRYVAKSMDILPFSKYVLYSLLLKYPTEGLW